MIHLHYVCVYLRIQFREIKREFLKTLSIAKRSSIYGHCCLTIVDLAKSVVDFNSLSCYIKRPNFCPLI